MSDKMTTLSATDNSFERARKIWKLLGFANDRLNATPQMAEYLEWYRLQDIKEKSK